jgi:Na+-translocating ferredoxin:NAD+ oxidoreductase subunit G
MAKKESTLLNMIATLFIITLVAGIALAGVYNVTKDPIAQARKAKLEKAISSVIPAFDELVEYKVKPDDGERDLNFYKGIKDGNVIGYAVETWTDKGFSGNIDLMVGFLPDGSINAIEVLAHKETPGLGTKMADPQFKDQFKSLIIGTLPNASLKVKKDGGTVDAITAATISSRAFCDAVLRAYNTHQKGGDQ